MEQARIAILHAGLDCCPLGLNLQQLEGARRGFEYADVVLAHFDDGQAALDRAIGAKAEEAVVRSAGSGGKSDCAKGEG